ncbi:T9SS type A sorting domain-containing protein [Aureibacter tunicatorum]|uniref:Secretion system C-terminal sorting domain-containing protein n=1 Tax=Aureibacter tunicatorum TaxID=866807 RepID=A0AAE3XK47_9BACT|nr:T9SS type A sorting domain-containing protein [Aureibacter tunicatorum]MDR6237390.1 hypothetical protein [Aureibacter tunicatorum]BDD06380.1 hypothetical protein AUTU_38630 [Aureibacter tunicatorum]
MKKTTKAIIAILLFCALAQSSFAQLYYNWAVATGGTSDDLGNAVQVDHNGASFFLGSFRNTVNFDTRGGDFNITSSGGTDAYLAKYDENGILIFAFKIGGSSSDYGYKLAVDSDGNAVIVGFARGNIDFDPSSATRNLNLTNGGIFVAKYSNDGSYLWAKSMGGNISLPSSIATDSENNIILGGTYTGTIDIDLNSSVRNITATSYQNSYVVKWNPQGNLQWHRNLGDSRASYVSVNVVGADSNDNVYFSGYYSGTWRINQYLTLSSTAHGSNNSAGFLVQTNRSGGVNWGRNLEIDGSNRTQNPFVGIFEMSVSPHNDGVYVAGLYRGAVNFNPPRARQGEILNIGNLQEVFVAKYQRNGQFSWVKSLNAGREISPTTYKISAKYDGSVIVTGSFNGTLDVGTTLRSDGNNQLYFVEYGEEGGLLKSQVYGSPGGLYLNEITTDSNDNLYLAGYFRNQMEFDGNSFTSNNRSLDLAIIKFSSCDTIRVNNNIEICQGDSVMIGSDYQSVSGTYVERYTTSKGCDSIISTVLTVNPSYSNRNVIELCNNDSIYLQGEYRQSSGTYYDTLNTTNGCDSVIISVLSVSPIFEESKILNINEGDSAFLGGNYQLNGGVYRDTLTSYFGCDSVIITSLNVFPVTHTLVETVICESDSAFVANTRYETEEGMYTDTLSNILNLDSVVVTNLIVNEVYRINHNASICYGDSVYLEGAFQKEAGLYIDTLNSLTLCDSIVRTQLSIIPIDTTRIYRSIISGDSALIAGLYRTESGEYPQRLASSLSCDSIVITTLDVLPPFMHQQAYDICSYDSIFLGNAYRRRAGIYYDTLTASQGGDSIIVSTLHIIPEKSSQNYFSIHQGDSIFLENAYQKEAGVYMDTTTSSLGCDSIIFSNLTVHPVEFTLRDINLCQGHQIYVGGGYQTLPGQFYDSLTSSQGGDSIVITNIKIKPTYTRYLNIGICPDDSLLVAGTYYDTAGTYYDSLFTTDGCDSVKVYQVGIYNQPQSSQTLEICSGDSILLHDRYVNAAGIYTDTLSSFQSCDSIVTTTLMVSPNYFSHNNLEICEGDSIYIFGEYRNESGIFYDSLTTINGCDSILMAVLNVQPVFQTMNTESICLGDSIFLGGNYVYNAGLYYDTLTAADGCDSVVITALNVRPKYLVNRSMRICQGDSILLGGKFVSQSGTYYDSLLTRTGCDSIISTQLNITIDQITNVFPKICKGDSILLSGEYRKNPGVFYDTLSSPNGCHQIMAHHLGYFPNPSNERTLTICQGDSLFLSGNYISQEGTYYDTLQSFNSCDSVIITHLQWRRINSADIDFSYFTNTKFCSDTSDLNLPSFDGFTSRYSGLNVVNNRFEVNSAGVGEHEVNYRLSDSFGCDVTGNFNINVQSCIVGIEKLNIDNRFIVYPNPAKDVLYIDMDLNGPIYNLKLEMHDNTGKLVWDMGEYKNLSGKKRLEFNRKKSLESGVYFIHFQTEKEVRAIKIMLL